MEARCQANETKIQVKRNPLESRRHKQRRHQLPPLGPDPAGELERIAQPRPILVSATGCGRQGAGSRTPSEQSAPVGL